MTDWKAATAIYYAIVGETTNTNEGLGRLIGVIVAFILVAGTFFWAIA